MDPQLKLETLRTALTPRTTETETSLQNQALPLAIPAAVLLPLIVHPTKITLLLTQRTAHLKDHPGQISFPGGRIESIDCSPIHTALRETEEEIGLKRQHIEVIGNLPQHTTGSGFHITPVLGLVYPPFQLHLDANEVAGTFELPLQTLLHSARHYLTTTHIQDIPLQSAQIRRRFQLIYDNHRIWGATAEIMMSLYHRIKHITI